MSVTNGDDTLDFQTEALKLLTDIKSDVGSLKTVSIANTQSIDRNSIRISWLERVVYGAITVGAALMFLFPHAGLAIAHLLSEKPPESRSIHNTENSE